MKNYSKLTSHTANSRLDTAGEKISEQKVDLRNLSIKGQRDGNKKKSREL